jgi:hypothetical protein
MTMAPAPINQMERLDDGVMELLASLMRPGERAALSECSRWGLATWGNRLLRWGAFMNLRGPGPVAVATPVSRTPGQTLAGLLRRHPHARKMFISGFADEAWEALGEALRMQPCPAVEDLAVLWSGRDGMGVKGAIQLGSALASQALPALKEMCWNELYLPPDAASWLFEPLSNPDNCPALESLSMNKETCDDDHVLAVALTSALRRRSEKGGRGLKSISLHPAGPGATEIFLNGGAALTTLEEVNVDFEWDQEPFSTDVIEALGGFLARTGAPVLAQLCLYVPIDGSLSPIFDAIRAGAAPRLRFLGIENLCQESVLQLAAAFEAGSLRQLAELELLQPDFDKHSMTRLVEGVLRSPGQGAALETVTMQGAYIGEDMADAGMIFFEGLERGVFPRLGVLSIENIDYAAQEPEHVAAGSFTDARAIRRFIRALEWGAPCASTLRSVLLRCGDKEVEGALSRALAAHCPKVRRV